MKTDLKEILESLPDFEQLSELASQIREASVVKLNIEKEIKKGEAQIVKMAVTDPAFAVNGKAPPVSFIEATYKYTGFNGELIPWREKYIEACGLLEELRMRMDIYKTMFDVWRTLSANERGNTML